MTKISALTPLGDDLAVGDQFIIRDIDDTGTPNKSVTISGITRGLEVGTALAPSIAFAADKNTGIYGTGSDVLALVTAGENRLHITAGGLVGIGTASPKSILTANGNIVGLNAGTHSWQHYQQAASSYTVTSIDSVISGASGSLVFKTGTNWTNGDAVEAARIRSDGMFEVKGAGTAGSSPAFSVNGSAPANSAIIDTSGRLLVGTTTTSATCNTLLQATGGTGGTLILSRNAATPADGEDLGFISFNDSAHIYNNAVIRAQRDGGTWTATTSKPSRLVFSTTADGASSPTEQMRIVNSGQILFNTSNSNAIHAGRNIVLTLAQNGDIAVNHSTSNSSGDPFARFGYNGTQIGSITQNGTTAVAYNTSSDYRLKENVTAVTNAITRFQQLKPSHFNFIGEPDRTVDGFLAHEAQEVVPECVTGEKDAVDEDGNPVYQGIDQSKLVPLLTAALQEAIAKIESLEARLTAAGIA